MEVLSTPDQEPVPYTIGNHIDDLDKILSPSLNLAVWKRESSQVQNVASEILNSDFTKLQFIYDRTEPIEVIGAFLDESVETAGENPLPLWADIMLLTEKMLQLCDDQEIGIGLERVTHDNCTSFHTDFLNLRLLCTYWGEATYWLENNNVNRDGLGKNNNDLVVRDRNQVHQMETHWVGLFKGDHYPGNKGLGIVHRSPEVSGKTNADRLLLRIDTIKSFGKENAE